MKTTTKLVLTFLIVLSAITSTKAQEKYEFMTINYRASNSSLISISIDGNVFLEEKIQLEKKDISYHNTNPLLLKVKEYQDMGWEVMNFSPLGYGNPGVLVHIAYLRKKKE